MEHTRRTFLLAGLGLLAGCAGTSREVALPATPWERKTVSTSQDRSPWTPLPDSEFSRPTAGAAGYPGMISRQEWANGNPIPTRMDRMTGISRITVHHDGMTAFWSDSSRDSAARLDAIRRAHQGAGWGDIGYHYIIDRAGRVWEGRPLNWQGAHVKDHNPGNIGVMCLGNFELQTPTDAQVRSLVAHLRAIQQRHGIRTRAVYTHKELRPTACPGRSLQSYMVSVRNNGHLLA